MKDDTKSIWLDSIDKVLGMLIELNYSKTFISVLDRKLKEMEEEYG